MRFFWVLAALTLFSLKVSSLPSIYHTLSNRRSIQVSQFRKLEKLAIKVVKWKLDIQYLQDCQYLGICPEFLKLKAPSLRANKDIRDLNRHAVQKQVDLLERELRSIHSRYISLKSQITGQLTLLERVTFISVLNEHIRNKGKEILAKHSDKLKQLWHKDRLVTPDCLTNVSNRQLTIEEEEALRYGLKHHILPKSVGIHDLQTRIEKTAKLISDDLKIDFFSTRLKDKVKHAVTSFVSRCKSVCNTTANRKLHKVLSDLRADESIRVCSYDKGNGILIMNASEYNDKLDLIIGDTTKFCLVEQVDSKNHPIIKQELSIQNSVRKHVSPLIDDEVHDVPWKITSQEYKSKLYPTGSQPGKLYGTAKVHKPGNPLRPVVSMVGTASYGLAQYLDRIIKPHIPDTYLLSSTAHFISKVKAFIFGARDTLVSFDVDSLFTNVPLKEVIDIVADYVYRVKEEAPPFSKTVFKNMLKHATGGFFLHKGQLYTQVDGVTMGSPLGPTLANFFLGHLEKQRLFADSQIKTLHPRLYLRYVDDVFAVFPPDIDPLHFLEILNNLHGNINFTVEIGHDKLPFLDTEICITGGNFESWVYRKSSNTNVLINAFALCPEQWKKGAVYSFLNRAWVVCSSKDRFLEEVEKLKVIFQKNGYSIPFFQKIQSAFLAKRETPPESQTDVDDDENIKRYVLLIPFVGKPSLVFKSKIRKIFKECLDVELRPVFESFKVKNYFSLKCKTPTYLCNNVTYKYTCQRDADVFYIGETTRHIVARAGEHLNISSPSQYPTAVGQHIIGCEYCCNALVLSVVNYRGRTSR